MTTAKEKQRINILQGAEQAFLENGIFNTSMEDIARGSGVTRRTLYRYFETREDLACEVLLKLAEQWNGIHREIYGTLHGSGIERLEQFLYGLINYMKDHRDFMRFTGEFDFYFKDDNPHKSQEDLLRRYDSTLHLSEDLIGSILRMGIEDGSILIDDDLKLLICTITNVLWSFGQRIAIRGEGIEKEFGVDPMDMIFCQVDFYIKGLKRNV